MAAIAKVGGFAALLRVFFSSFHTLAFDWQPILWVVAIVTLVTGAVLGLVQRDIKRMLAYSSINHAGFVLLGLQAASVAGIAGSLYYVFIYAFLVLGSFTVVSIVGARGDRDHDLEAYRGLGRRQPVLALCFAILLLAQAGAPFTTGFLAKLYVVEAAVQAHSYALAVVAMLSGAVAAAFYLRVVFLMYGGAATTASATADAVADTSVGVGQSAGDGVPAGGVVLIGADASGTGGGPAGVGAAAGGEVVTVVESEAGGEAGAEADPDPELVGVVAVRAQRFEVPAGAQVGLLFTVGFTVVLGIWPAPLFDFVHAAGLLF
jgi:NADH:ubiquinone oxidoreductase subunit 2 (subunit N)